MRNGIAPAVVAIAGRTSSGKSTLARRLADSLGWPVAAFGAYVRSEARRLNLDTRRETLQELGVELVETVGWNAFVQATLKAAGIVPRDHRGYVVEGVRHREALVSLRALAAPLPVILVYLEVSDKVRDDRLRSRGVSVQRGRAWELHSTEGDIGQILRLEADLVVLSSEDACRTVMSYLSNASMNRDPI
jgi:dephospho-CoA kinase